DALRMVYEFDNQTIRQKNRGIEGKLFELSTYGIGEFAGLSKEETVHRITQHADRIQRSFDLKKGPMLRMGLFNTPMGDYLLIVIHHFVIDAVSWRILLEEFQMGYPLAAQKKAIVFQEKTDSFKQWAHVLTTYAQSKTLLMELPYWKVVEKTKVKKLPVDNKIRAYKRKFKYLDTVSIQLTGGETDQLLKKVNPAYNTEINHILLTALGLAVKQWTGMDRVPVHLEGHGREKIVGNIEIERTLGWFTTIYPVVLEFSQTGDIGSAIK
ncbi:MAG: non-ribosomal peptide synthetase, partial [bacterium]|nr:non-ribosomal peptide synthetase [bacterium]